MGVKIEVDAEGTIRDGLKKAAELGINLTIPFTSIAKSWFKGNKSMFLLKGRGQYDDLKDETKIFKQKEYGFTYPILKARGDLEKSVTDPTDSNSINLIVNKVALYLGSKIPYGVYHQSPEPRTKMPLRPFVLLGVEQVATGEQKQFEARTVRTIYDHIGQTLSKAFGDKPSGAV